MNEFVRSEVEGGVALVTIDRPEALNALSFAVLTGLEEAFTALKLDSSVRAVILTGKGKAFVAGADIKGLAVLDCAGARELALRGQRIYGLIDDFPHPVIAAVNGFALGGGCELALACDLRIASDRAKAGQPEVNLGVLPGYGGTQRLGRLIGWSNAKYLVFTGEIIGAERALAMGLFNEVVAPEALLPRCREIAAAILAKAPIAVSYCKQAMNFGAEATLAQGIAHEAELFALAFATADQKEGMRAFFEKRPPRFQGA